MKIIQATVEHQELLVVMPGLENILWAIFRKSSSNFL